jgi:HTH-type transcriptional regulator, sugar sensing transcriptional regulator
MSSSFKFEEIGLETRDKRVFEALSENPKSSLRSIADITGINRGSVYESIKALAEHGLVGSIEVGKQRRYIASDPSVIIELLKERQHQAREAENSASEYIKTLAPTPNSEAIEIPFATYYEDHEGVAAILRDVIATCSSLGVDYRAISTKKVRSYLYQNFPNFTQRRIAEGIGVRVIAVGLGGTTDKLSARKWLKATRGEAPNCYTIIYGDKTAFISMNEANVLSGIVIDNAGVAHLQKELFDRLWQTS